MPIVHRQYRAQAQGSNGEAVAVSPAAALGIRGPLLQVAVMLPQAIIKGLQERGETVPEPVAGEALIDTGASLTCVDIEVARQLRLPEVGRTLMQSASHSDQEMPLFPVGIDFPNAGLHFEPPRAMGANLKTQGIVILVGMDALSNCTLYYNGPAGQITLSI